MIIKVSPNYTNHTPMYNIAAVILGQVIIVRSIHWLTSHVFVSCFIANISLVVSVVIKLEPPDVLKSSHPP